MDAFFRPTKKSLTLFLSLWGAPRDYASKKDKYLGWEEKRKQKEGRPWDLTIHKREEECTQLKKEVKIGDSARMPTAVSSRTTEGNGTF